MFPGWCQMVQINSRQVRQSNSGYSKNEIATRLWECTKHDIFQMVQSVLPPNGPGGQQQVTLY